jgi:hypothetical protein
MTRETKVGLVVAGSFLILVGIVVASKLRNGDPGSGVEEQSVSVAAVTPAPEKSAAKGTEQKKVDAPQPVVPAKKADADPPLPTNVFPPPNTDTVIPILKDKVAQVQNQGTEFPPPAPIPQVQDSAKPLQGLGDKQPNSPMEFGKLPDSPQKNGQPVLTLPPPKDNELKFPPLDPTKKDNSFPPLDPAKKEVVTFPPLDPTKKDVVTFPPLDPTKKDVVTFPPLDPTKKDVTFPPLDAKKDGVVFPALPEKKKDNMPPIVNSPGDGNPTLPPAKKDDGIAPPNGFVLPADPKTNSTIPPLTDRTQPVSPFNAKDGLPTLQPIVGDTLPKKDIVPLPPVMVNPKDQAKPAIGVSPTFPESPPKTIPPLGTTELPSTPPLTTNPANINTALPRPVERSLDFTKVNPGETNFAQISKRLYGSEKYAGALYAFNVANKDMIKNGGSLATNPPLLTAEQQLLHPAPELLHRDYAKYIQDTTPTIPASSPAVKLAPPPVTITPPTVPTISTVSNPPAGQGRTYVVQSPNGERIRDIAQRALGNADRWTEIYRVNQNLNLQPQFPIPNGTRLTLPGN